MSNISKQNDIVLILPPKRFKEHRYSLGIMYISGYLRDHGYDNTIIESKILGGKNYEYDRQKTRKEIIETAIKLRPKIIGFTANTVEIGEVVWINKQIRSQIDCYSIIGGPHVTASSVEVLRSGFDVAVIGEGELTALELVKELNKNNTDLSQVRGIAWFDKNKNEIKINEDRELIDISDLSLPAYDKVNMGYHAKVWDDIIRGIPIKSVMIMASRGCPYSCTFCACNRVYGHQVRYRSLDNIKKEILLLKDKYGVEGVWFADDTLTVNYNHVKKVCEIMKELGMYWGAQSRVDLTSEEVVKLIKDSGCLQLDFGVESGSQRVLDKIINKRIKLEDIVRAFDLCHKYGIRTEASFMIGLPGESKDEMKKTFEFAQNIKSDHYSFSLFMPLPGTSLYDNFFHGQLTLDDYNQITFHNSNNKLNKSNVETQELNKLFKSWRLKLFEGVKKRGLKNSFRIFIIWFKLGNKKERFDFIMFKIGRASKYYLNKIGFKFLID